MPFKIHRRMLMRYLPKEGETVVAVPWRVQSVANCAFSNCRALEAVVFPSGTRVIEDFAFSGCTALKSVTFGKYLRMILPSAFAGCTALEQIDLPEKLMLVEDRAFSGCTSLKTVRVRGTQLTIHTNAFAGCSALSEIVLPADIPAESSLQKWLESECESQDSRMFEFLLRHGNLSPELMNFALAAALEAGNTERAALILQCKAQQYGFSESIGEL